MEDKILLVRSRIEKYIKYWEEQPKDPWSEYFNLKAESRIETLKGVLQTINEIIDD